MKLNIKKITTYFLFSFFLLTPTVLPIKLKPNTDLIGKIKLVVGKRGWIEKGEVTAISGSTLTITKDGVTYTVNTDDKTNFKRKFGGKGQLSEISVNDTVNVLGKWQNEEKTQILATHIRDLSIQKRHATFFGIVKTKTDSSLVLTTVNRGEQMMTIDISTKLVNRKMEEIKMADIQLGNRIRVKGIWDLTNKIVSEVTQIKDFSIPVQPSSVPTAD
ncbi:MAG: DUF5666 domain-containing protein [Candidatus Woesebacteria bacterium]|nr:DUF5666 domain-containing protein [Candidatus Woesebacteria bacterium]